MHGAVWTVLGSFWQLAPDIDSIPVSLLRWIYQYQSLCRFFLLGCSTYDGLRIPFHQCICDDRASIFLGRVWRDWRWWVYTLEFDSFYHCYYTIKRRSQKFLFQDLWSISWCCTLLTAVLQLVLLVQIIWCLCSDYYFTSWPAAGMAKDQSLYNNSKFNVCFSLGQEDNARSPHW